MIKSGGPLTRERYISLAFDQAPEEWTHEHEMMLPTIFRRDPLPADAWGNDRD